MRKIKSNTIKLFIIGLIFSLLMCISGVYALTKTTNETSLFNADAVKIELDQFSPAKNVIPGEKIALETNINNSGASCYVRAKLLIFVDSKELENPDNYILGISENWQKVGEYYYSKNIVTSKSKINLFNEFIIPEDLNGNDIENLQLRVIVEAIQAKNLNQDLSNLNPWGDVQILNYIDTAYSFKGLKTIVEYENNTENYIKLAQDFFNDLSNLLPGDTISKNIEIVNNTIDSSEYFLNIKCDKLSAEETDLLKNIKLIIKDTFGNVIYNGSIIEANNVSLGKYKLNENGNLNFSICVPKDLSNNVLQIDSNLTFVFSAQYEKANNFIFNPKTGDTIDISVAIFLASALGLVIVLFLEHNNRIKEKGKGNYEKK